MSLPVYAVHHSGILSPQATTAIGDSAPDVIQSLLAFFPAVANENPYDAITDPPIRGANGYQTPITLAGDIERFISSCHCPIIWHMIGIVNRHKV